MNSTLAENLKRLLKQHDINSSALSKASGVDKPRISRMLSGKTTNPQIDSLKPIAEYFNITIDQLIGKSPLPHDQTYGNLIPINRLLIPVIDWENAPYWLQIKDKYRPEKTIDAKSDTSPSSFALQVKNNEFDPVFVKNSLIIVDPTASPKNRNYILTSLPENNSVIAAQLITANDKMFIKKLKNTADMVEIKGDELVCYGVVSEIHLNVI